MQDFAFDRATKSGVHLPAVGERNHADETPGAMRVVAQAFQQQAVIRRVGRVGAGVARRTNAWRAVQCVYFKAGIVGEQRPGANRL